MSVVGKNSVLDPVSVENQVKRWLQEVVIGLNLCPFAAKPTRAGSVRFAVSDASSEETVLETLQEELARLGAASPAEIETTLVITPNALLDFYDYNQFLDWVDQLLRREQWEGEIQVASFHPRYCFAGTEEGDPENLTNRSPYPIFHLIREDSLSEILEKFPDSDRIPEANILRMEGLSLADKQRLFPYLFSTE